MKHIKYADDASSGNKIHLIIGSTQKAIEDAAYDVRCHFADSSSCLILKLRPGFYCKSTFGNDLHWQDVQKEVDFLASNEKFKHSFLGTMNPSVMDTFEFDSADDAHRRILLAGPFRNMTDKQTNSFWKSYEAGIQHVSEILRMEGIW